MNEAWCFPEYSHDQTQAPVLESRALRRWLSTPRLFTAPAEPARPNGLEQMRQVLDVMLESVPLPEWRNWQTQGT